ncbi:MAG: hypothetical protein SOX43_09095 [Pelistega sp.]|nr:hypothetical protein [Pelistega sp.]
MVATFLAYVLAIGSFVLLLAYRQFIYAFYCRYPRDRHFYAVKSFRQSSSYWCLGFWWLLYSVLAVWSYRWEQEIPYALPLLLVMLNSFAFISSLDVKLHLIPLRFIFGLWGIFLYEGWGRFDAVEQLFMLGILCLLYGVTRRGIGLGDIYLLAAFSFLFPMFQWLWLILLAALLGVCYGLMLRLLRISSSDTLAFAPWICLSAWLILWLA